MPNPCMTGLTFDRFAAQLAEYGIQTMYGIGTAIEQMRIRTEQGDHYIASAWVEKDGTLVLDLGQRVPKEEP